MSSRRILNNDATAERKRDDGKKNYFSGVSWTRNCVGRCLFLLLISAQLTYLLKFYQSTQDIGKSSSLLNRAMLTANNNTNYTPFSGTEADGKDAVVPRYHEVLEQIKENVKQKKNLFETSYKSSTVISSGTTTNQTSSWFTPQKICHEEKCCAETVAIPLNQDSNKIVNTMDAYELADLVLQHYTLPPHATYHASTLHEDMLPCLQPGTIISLETHDKILNYFFLKLRKNITVPYIIITSRSDGDSPRGYGKELDRDELMLNWYGTNPNLVEPNPKFTPMPLGLSIHHNQERLLASYLEVTKFSNPFRNKDRWLSQSHILSHADIFVKLGNMETLGHHRKAAWNILCGSNHTSKLNTDGVSCVEKTGPPDEVYPAASTYLFAVSPPGAGYDCYRTYEWLLLGVIPIVMERPSSKQLFEDLPVVLMPRSDMYDENTQRGLQKYITAIQNYTQSSAFQNNTFDKGWKRLFLNYWRRRILKDARRDQQILKDEQGTEYYQAWKYTPTYDQEMLCHKEENCNLDGHRRW
mmetsp:Transcript_16150/g.22747  ORF Transcript_16150/g.22747 Transcript_16150/m.22747 type:complete len:526 (-) Transcript_16150:305-1882(-)